MIKDIFTCQFYDRRTDKQWGGNRESIIYKDIIKKYYLLTF